jgi:DNA processing protein
MEHTSRRLAALRMFLVHGLGLRSANALIKHFKDPERVFDGHRTEIEALGVPPEVIGDLLSTKSADLAKREWERAEALGITIIDILDPAYPPLLREIFDPPIILYICGKNWDPDLPQVAIVGTRRPTGYGLNCGERLSEDLAKRGIAITSGLARGIDSTAHRGAARAGAT